MEASDIMKNMKKELVKGFWKIPGLSNQNGTDLEQTDMEASLTLRDDPFHVQENEATHGFLSKFHDLQLEDDDEIELEPIAELEIENPEKMNMQKV